MSYSKDDCGVYALLDPISGRRVYIGISFVISKRYEQHLYAQRNPSWHNPKLAEYLLDLARQKLKPKLEILQLFSDGVLSHSAMMQAERDFIAAEMLQGNKLLNLSRGGGARGSSLAMDISQADLGDLEQGIEDCFLILSSVLTQSRLPAKITKELHRAFRDLQLGKTRIHDWWYDQFGPNIV